MEQQIELNLPFELPESLRSYATQYQADPEKAIRNLTSYLKKRGMDAIGYFLLSWLHHLQGNKEQAIDVALKARSFAPGSPLLEYIHYFLVHPQQWEAFIPNQGETPVVPKKSIVRNPILDLDKLIQKLTKAENRKIQIQDSGDDEDMSAYSENTDDIATETIAKIYEQQGKLKEAVGIYQRLKTIKPGQKKHYKQEIKRLKEIIAKQEST